MLMFLTKMGSIEQLLVAMCVISSAIAHGIAGIFKL